MARRWLVAAVLLLTLGGCGDEPAAEPATVPVPATSSGAPARPTAAASQAGETQAARAAPGAAGENGRPRPAGCPAAARRGSGCESGFVAVVQRELPGVAVDRRDEEIAALAEQTCAALAAGRSADAVLAGMRSPGTDRAGARELVRLAIATECPEHDRRIDEF